MAMKKHLGIFGIDAHKTPNITSAFGDGCLQWLFGDVPGSIVRYMHDASGGLIDISGAEIFGFGVADDPGIVTKLGQPTRRNVAAQCALAIAQSMGAGDLGRFDGLIFVVRGVAVDGGATAVRLDDRTVQCAIFDSLGQHSFMAHEVGHVIGLDHSFDLGFTNNPNGYLYGEYGDPTDIMSAMTYGGKSCTFAMPPVPSSDIKPDATLWTMCGPGISPATLWRFLPGFPALPPWAVQLDPAGPATPITLKAAGHLGTTMAVLPWPGFHGGWWTIEYRPARDWDRGLVLEDGDHKNAPGVVIHILRDIGTGQEDPSYPRLKRVTYESTIPVPSAGDNDWTGGSFGVRVVNATAAEVQLLVGQLPNQQRAALTIQDTPGVPATVPAGQEWVPLAGPDCNGAFHDTERTSTPVEVAVSLQTWGFEYPIFDLFINGHQLPEGTPTTSAPKASFQVEVDVQVPTGTFKSVTAKRTISIQWSRAASTWTLQLPAGDGTWNLQVSANVREGGMTTPLATTSQSIDVTTQSIELSAQAAVDLERCIRRLTQKLKVRDIPLIGMPSQPGPVEHPDWSQLRGLSLVHAIAHLRDLEYTFPKTARELRIQVAGGMQVPARQLRWLEDRLPG